MHFVIQGCQLTKIFKPTNRILTTLYIKIFYPIPSSKEPSSKYQNIIKEIIAQVMQRSTIHRIIQEFPGHWRRKGVYIILSIRVNTTTRVATRSRKYIQPSPVQTNQGVRLRGGRKEFSEPEWYRFSLCVTRLCVRRLVCCLGPWTPFPLSFPSSFPLFPAVEIRGTEKEIDICIHRIRNKRIVVALYILCEYFYEE